MTYTLCWFCCFLCLFCCKKSTALLLHRLLASSMKGEQWCPTLAVPIQWTEALWFFANRPRITSLPPHVSPSPAPASTPEKVRVGSRDPHHSHHRDCVPRYGLLP